MSQTGTLLVNRDDAGVVTITFNRPQVRNALDWATMDKFTQAVRELEDDLDLRAVIMTGAGDEAFCSGGDLNALHDHVSEADGGRLTLMGDTLSALERLPVPVIAAVNGYAVGGGCEIALACDLRIVAETVKMGMIHLRLALIPGWGGGQRLARLIGYSRAMQMLLTARTYNVQELYAMGLVNVITPPQGALGAAQDFAAQVAAADTGAVRAIKAILQASYTVPYDEALATDRALFPAIWAGQAHLDAVSGFMNQA